jgi:hypothetical protein
MIYPTARAGARSPPPSAAPNGAWAPMPPPAPDLAAYLARLRAEFPHFGILADPRGGVWIAVRGRHLTIRASSGALLRERLLAATRR